ncbi:hypothetical protein Tco_0900569 [Tanacetum coccineum]
MLLTLDLNHPSIIQLSLKYHSGIGAYIKSLFKGVSLIVTASFGWSGPKVYSGEYVDIASFSFGGSELVRGASSSHDHSISLERLPHQSFDLVRSFDLVQSFDLVRSFDIVWSFDLVQSFDLVRSFDLPMHARVAQVDDDGVEFSPEGGDYFPIMGDETKKDKCSIFLLLFIICIVLMLMDRASYGANIEPNKAGSEEVVDLDPDQLPTLAFVVLVHVFMITCPSAFDAHQLCARLIFFRRIDDNAEMSIYNFMTLPSWSDAKIVEESHHLSLPLLELVASHTTAPTTEGAIILLPTPGDIAGSLPDSHLVKKSKDPSQASRPSKRRKLQKRASKASSNAPELDQAEGADEADLADLCAEIENSLERDEAVTSVSDPSHVGTSSPASTFGRSFSHGGNVAGGRVGSPGLRWILDDDFGTTTRGEEIDLTLFPLDPGPYHMPYPKALDRTITPAELRRTESLLPLELSNHVNVLSALLVSHGYELNSRYANLVSSKAHIQEKFDKKKGDVKLLCSKVRKLQSQLTDVKTTSASLSEELTRTDAKLSEQALTVRELQNELVLKKSESQEYKDAIDGLREEVTQFVGSGVESLVRKLLSSDEFHVALARVASLGINYGVERGLRMGRTDVEFEAAVQKVSNFHVGAKADFDKALDNFPTTPFPFLSKIAAAFEDGLPDVA